MNCKEQCVGHCKDNTSCNSVTGQCDGGCDTGWTGFHCNKGNKPVLLFKDILH